MNRENWLVATSIALTALGVGCSYLFSDVHYIQRFGAIISGTAALFVVLQVIFELKLEGEKALLEEQKTDDINFNLFGPKRELALDLLDERTKNKINELRRRRMRFVFVVAACAFYGEIIHGFGDLVISKFIPH